MHGRIWTVSNGLSFLRVLLVAPIVMLLRSGRPEDRFLAALVIAAAVSTDFFDGLIARKMGQVSDLGKIIDPVADKIGIGAVAAVLALEGSVPVWFLSIVLVRDVAIFLGGLYVQRTRGVILQSTPVGKWAVTVLSLYILLTVLDMRELGTATSVLFVASVALLAVSFGAYVRRFFAVMRGAAPAS